MQAACKRFGTKRAVAMSNSTASSRGKRLTGEARQVGGTSKRGRFQESAKESLNKTGRKRTKEMVPCESTLSEPLPRRKILRFMRHKAHEAGMRQHEDVDEQKWTWRNSFGENFQLPWPPDGYFVDPDGVKETAAVSGVPLDHEVKRTILTVVARAEAYAMLNFPNLSSKDRNCVIVQSGVLATFNKLAASLGGVELRPTNPSTLGWNKHKPFEGSSKKQRETWGLAKEWFEEGMLSSDSELEGEADRESEEDRARQSRKRKGADPKDALCKMEDVKDCFEQMLEQFTDDSRLPVEVCMVERGSPELTAGVIHVYGSLSSGDVGPLLYRLLNTMALVLERNLNKLQYKTSGNDHAWQVTIEETKQGTIAKGSVWGILTDNDNYLFLDLEAAFRLNEPSEDGTETWSFCKGGRVHMSRRYGLLQSYSLGTSVGRSASPRASACLDRLARFLAPQLRGKSVTEVKAVFESEEAERVQQDADVVKDYNIYARLT